MAKLKSERHHWWPECVSQHWADSNGGVNWLLPSGEVRRSSPENFGIIGNGHHIKLAKTAGEESPWDISFEQEFQRADNSFPRIINWLNDLHRTEDNTPDEIKARITSVHASDEDLAALVECIVSLAVRSPMHRETAVSAAEYYRGSLRGPERNGLIGLNMRHSQQNAVRALAGSGKMMIVYSPEREFIYGDGFFHNIFAPVERLHNVRLFAPITPSMAVVYALPMRYMVEPRLVTLVATAEETERLNFAVHVYARNAIFFRSEKPEMTDAYRRALHLRFGDRNNDIDRLIDCLPGMLPRR